MKKTEKILCPSGTCQEGAILIGIVMRDGRVAFSPEQITIDREFVEIAQAGRAPEKRFRFGNTCVKSGCRQWSDERCGVIDSLVAEPPNTRLQNDEFDQLLPECSIRSQCRWFVQLGAKACEICPEVVTDARVENN